MRRLKIFAVLMTVALFGLARWCLGATYSIAAGASVATIQSTINSAAAASGGNTVAFAGGVYNITSQISIPCPASALTITGPAVAYSQTPNQTAILHGSVAGNWGLSLGGYGCTTPVTIQYLEWNGGEPSPDGGGFLYIAPGTSNFTLQNNYIHGNQANVNNDEKEYDGLVWFDGNPSGDGYTDTNDTIQWNIFGNAVTPGVFDSNADCSALADLYSYQGGSLAEYGGNCNSIGIIVATTNLAITNNIIHYQEEGIKFFEGNDTSSGTPIPQVNDIIRYNDIEYIHRIPIEMQQGAPGNVQPTPPAFTVDVSYNDTINPANPSYGSFTWSIAQSGVVNSTNNVIDQNLLAPGATLAGPGVEFWGNGALNNNLAQGYSSAMLQYGYDIEPLIWEIENNILQQLGGANLFISNEEGITCCYPTMSNNTEVTTVSAITSAAPTISPASGAYTSPPTITLTDAGVTSGGLGPQGNTGIWYTTDGSTPVPGSGTAKYYTGPFSITLPVTINAVGMWGAQNQPTSYPRGYGFVPSSVVSASYTATGGLVLTGVTLSNIGSVHTLNTGASIQMNAICTYSDGSNTNCNTADVHGQYVSSWNTSASSVVGINGSGLATGVAAGSANLTAVVSGLTSPVWAMADTTPTQSLTSVTLSTTGGISSLVAGGVNQLLAQCGYSDGSSDSCGATDAHGNVVNPWTSTAPSVATVSSSGVVTAVAAGSSNLTATVSPSSVSSQWGQQGVDSPGDTYPGAINATYVVLGNQPGGYTGGSCYFQLPSGTLTNGALYDCGLIPAPSPTTQGTSWQCWYTYTVSSTTSPGTFVGGPMNSCGNMAPGSTWWLAVDSNAPGPSPAGFSSCGGSPCNGSAPTSAGTGTYPYRAIIVPYGTRTGMPTAMNATGSTVQTSQYVTLGQPLIVSNTVPLTVTAAAPTLSSAYLVSAGNATTMTVGGTLQFSAHCVYSDGSTTDCTVADIHGNAVTVWTTSNSALVTIGAVGSAKPGLATAIAAGTATIQANVGPVVATPAFNLTISPPAVTLKGISLATTGGVTGMFVGQTNQLIATCLYSDDTTTNCTATDSHGNVARSYASSITSHATINATTGLVTGIAPGGTNLTAQAGGFTSPAIPLTVLAVPSGVYVITITGPVQFSGTVRF